MLLPELIEIVPLSQPVQATVTVPGSKSITNRALVLAALGAGRTVLRGALWSEDTQVMVQCLRQLGFEVDVSPDPLERCNRTIAVEGHAGRIPLAGSAEKPLELFVGNAGTAARFLTALVCLGRGAYRLHGVDRMHERPQSSLFEALRQLGYRIESPNSQLPAVVFGSGPRKGECRVSIEESSQFASALLLPARDAGWTVRVAGANTEELPYVEMTRRLIETFPRSSGEFAIEPDASSGSYFLAAGILAPAVLPIDLNRAMTSRPVMLGPNANVDLERDSDARSVESMPSRSIIQVVDWPKSGWQVDAAFPRFLPLPDRISRLTDLADSIMTAVVLAPFASRPIRFIDLGRLRVQECERVAALRTELTRCGAKVLEAGDTLTVFPSAERLHGASFETYNDHRMAMCFALLGLKVPGVKIKNPSCVKKTFPDFFQKLAQHPPTGLGVTIRHGITGDSLSPEELFAA